MKAFYILLMIVSALAGYGVAGYFVITNGGFDLSTFIGQMTATPGAWQALADLLITGLIVYVWTVYEGTRLKMAHPWIYIVMSFVGGGLCFGLALFLYKRHQHLEKRAASPA